ncbi:DEKNAAC100135 [Brettanomyces naardenensis]|uniref:DEKNAAC100135 n=1 Tax=Brettanomyces naardenensis TaxID=13370 RepID=A0A448YEW6_BRENA|nr:DEKNAAC100135 [Brettanomyces naardenensis]
MIYRRVGLRFFSSTSKWLSHNSSSPFQVFDRHVKLIQRERAAVQKESNLAEYLRDEIAKRTVQRLSFLTIPFDNVLDYGSHGGNFERAVGGTQFDEKVERYKDDRLLVKSKIRKITMVDSSAEMLYKCAEEPFNRELDITRIVADEETFANPSLKREDEYDLIVSNLSMHWINDLPGAFSHLYHCLKPDRCFMGTMFGGDTLFELRSSFQLAEIERYGGVSPRISPFVGSSDVGSLMQKAGFQMLTVDVQELVVEYPSVVALMTDLQLMGENNAVMTAPPSLTKDLLIAVEPIYMALYGNRETGRIPATFRLVNMIGWKPGEHLSQPVARGSATINLKDALDKKD